MFTGFLGLSAATRTVVLRSAVPGVLLRSTPRAGSPAEHLGWGARLYAVGRYRGLVDFIAE